MKLESYKTEYGDEVVAAEDVRAIIKEAFDAGWDGAIKWSRSEYPDNMGRKIYVEELEKFLREQHLLS
jgi:hypothetical protein